MAPHVAPPATATHANVRSSTRESTANSTRTPVTRGLARMAEFARQRAPAPRTSAPVTWATREPTAASTTPVSKAPA